MIMVMILLYYDVHHILQKNNKYTFLYTLYWAYQIGQCKLIGICNYLSLLLFLSFWGYSVSLPTFIHSPLLPNGCWDRYTVTIHNSITVMKWPMLMNILITDSAQMLVAMAFLASDNGSLISAPLAHDIFWNCKTCLKQSFEIFWAGLSPTLDT